MTWAWFNSLTVSEKTNWKEQIDPVSIYHGQSYGWKNYKKIPWVNNHQVSFFQGWYCQVYIWFLPKVNSILQEQRNGRTASSQIK